MRSMTLPFWKMRTVPFDSLTATATALVARVIAAIAPHDSQERFEGLGVEVIRDWAEFTSPREVRAGKTLIRN